MWQLNLKRLETFAPAGFGNIAIETGTCRGNGTKLLAKFFPRVISIELSEELFRTAKARFELEGLANIELLQGDSVNLLPSILESLPPEAKLFFFLDAHWSGDSTVSWKESAWAGYGIDTAHLGKAGDLPSSEQQCPLDRELEAIVSLWRGSALLLIDDTKNLPPHGNGKQNVAFQGEDWSHLSRERLREILSKRDTRITELLEPDQWFVEMAPLKR